VRHFAALALAVAVAVSPSMASSAHVHEYVGHAVVGLLSHVPWLDRTEPNAKSLS
jgi:hypothetical protein